MRSRVVLAAVAILLVGAGAVALVYAFTQPGAPWAPSASHASGQPAPPLPGPGGPAPADLPPPPAAPAPGEPVAPPVVHLGPAPPPRISQDPEKRAEELTDLRRDRYQEQMQQLNQRGAARRQRAGLGPAPAVDPVPPPSAPQPPGSPRPPSRRGSLSSDPPP